MEAKELMIGNYVQYDNLKKPIRVSIIDTTETSSKTKAKPIPLTEEWLINFGNVKKIKIKLNDLNDLNVLEVFERFYFIWKNEYSYWYVITKSNDYLTKIEFVHEYQNFIFVLAGKELTLEKKYYER